MNGKLIVFEGIYACGKTTQIKLIKEHLISEGYEVVDTKWNSSEIKPFTDSIKLQGFTPLIWFSMHLADFILRYEKIVKPALNSGKIVLADRWVYTAFVRDSIKGVPLDYLEKCYSFAKTPDLTLIFDLPEQESLNRRRVKGVSPASAGLDLGLSNNLEESYLKYQQLMRMRYSSYVYKEQTLKLNAINSIESIFESITGRITELIRSD
ncbi:dTMP kinase [Brevibacillus panacihumi W25]|uniref:Thymidylate kinase n=1 Tax=Brevibacillus panacihumi W25 TaxID=1408254 RepID=V6M8B7_9BACL|nr:dTMP kinase [Brevibacillus panacihumi]EST51573.1 dTMP kinase [Brevibacillus panacihumi W25]